MPERTVGIIEYSRGDDDIRCQSQKGGAFFDTVDATRSQNVCIPSIKAPRRTSRLTPISRVHRRFTQGA
jgi:hypothetical protein